MFLYLISFIHLLSLKQACNKETKIKTKWPKLQTANDLNRTNNSNYNNDTLKMEK